MASHRSLEGAVQAHAAVHAGAPALIGSDGQTWSYGRLAAQLNHLGAALERCASTSSPVIAVAGSNGAALVTGIVAAMTRGVCAPLNPDRPGDEIDAFFSDLAPAIVVADDAAIALHEKRFFRHGATVIRIMPDLAITEAFGAFEETRGADEIVLVARTSGTTSSAKIVPHTSARLMHIFDAIVEAVELSASDRCFNARPMHHLHAITHVIGASLVAGASIVCPSETSATAIVHGLSRYKPTWYSASPPVHRDVLAVVRALPRPPEHVLRFIRSSSAALESQLAADLEAALGTPVLQGYGMSEAPAIALNPPPPLAHKLGSVGRPVGCEIAIIDGEVHVRGANVAPAYANGGGNAIAGPTGWFRTGDTGIIDDDGYLFLTGRLNELVNVGGEKVAPGSVERALLTHRAVAEAVAFPLPHPTLGQHMAAAVVVTDGAAVSERQLMEHAARSLPRHAIPNVVHQVAAIARDANGKVRRRELAATFARDTILRSVDPTRATDDSLLHALVRIWEEVLEYAPVAIDENFFAAGGDSLRAVRVMMRVEERLGVAMSLDTLLFAPTIVTMAQTLLAHAGKAHPNRIVALRTTGSRPPLFFFDGDINGGGFYARFLLAALHSEQPVYVVRPNGTLGDAIPETIEAMADADAAMICAAVPSEAYRLAGFCNGGVIAFEVARRLEAAGAKVDLVALIASSAPNAGLDLLWPLASAIARGVPQSDAVSLFRHLRSLANALRATCRGDELRRIAGSAWWRCARLLHLAPAQPLRPAEPGRSSPGYLVYRDRLVRYFPKYSRCSVDLIWADDDGPRIAGDDSMGWRHVAQVRRHSVRGNHTTMLTDHVDELGAALRCAFDAADN